MKKYNIEYKMANDQNQNIANNKQAYLDTISGSSAILHFNVRHFRAAIVRSGTRVDHREGDGSTPVGIWPLRHLFYRVDRLNAPNVNCPCEPLDKDDG